MNPFESILDAFEGKLKQGHRPDIAACLEKVPTEQRDGLLRELIGLDMHYRRQVGEKPIMGDYEKRFPNLVIGSLASGTPTVDAPRSSESTLIAGRYRLLERLGEGGMGQVWLAEQRIPVKRQVAIKLIRPGMDTEGVLVRFEAERQALALMDHPNIARVMDGGTTENGRPYFVMELVRGLSLTDYCDQHRLGVRERLDLFSTVCSAVQHAHQKGSFTAISNLETFW